MAAVESDSSETIKFHWKVSSEQNGDYLQFYIDSTLKDQISGEVDWQQKSYSVTSGIHVLKWRYVKNGSGESGDDCGWVDFVQWTGPSPAQDPENWQEIAYKHDVTGQRVEKKVDGYSIRYVYDGSSVIAEYDGNNNLLRKYIYGPGIDQPVSMIEVADSNATYYYHFDALGSVVALSDSAGDTVQTYQYSVYGEVAVEDANHTNPYMFASRRYDIEIGLYYNRARYYNPFTGRFLQTDPISAGINLYAYCGNNPLVFSDPSGLYKMKKDPIPIASIMDPSKFTDWSAYAAGGQIDDWLREVGFYDLYPDWSLDSVEVSGKNVILTLYCDDEKRKGNDPSFSVSWLDITEAGSVVRTVPIALLNSEGLLNDWTLKRILEPAIQRVNGWDRDCSWQEKFSLLMGSCDTPFRTSKIEKWRYKRNMFDNDDMNYILEDHAMRHLNIPSYTAARTLVWLHKRRNTESKRVTPGVVYWFDKGWNGYDARSSW